MLTSCMLLARCRLPTTDRAVVGQLVELVKQKLMIIMHLVFGALSIMMGCSQHLCLLVFGPGDDQVMIIMHLVFGALSIMMGCSQHLCLPVFSP